MEGLGWRSKRPSPARRSKKWFAVCADAERMNSGAELLSPDRWAWREKVAANNGEAGMDVSWRLATDWKGIQDQKWLAKTFQVKQKAAVEDGAAAGKVDEDGQSDRLAACTVR